MRQKLNVNNKILTHYKLHNYIEHTSSISIQLQPVICCHQHYKYINIYCNIVMTRISTVCQEYCLFVLDITISCSRWYNCSLHTNLFRSKRQNLLQTINDNIKYYNKRLFIVFWLHTSLMYSNNQLMIDHIQLENWIIKDKSSKR